MRVRATPLQTRPRRRSGVSGRCQCMHCDALAPATAWEAGVVQEGRWPRSACMAADELCLHATVCGPPCINMFICSPVCHPKLNLGGVGQWQGRLRRRACWVNRCPTRHLFICKACPLCCTGAKHLFARYGACKHRLTVQLGVTVALETPGDVTRVIPALRWYLATTARRS